VIIQCWKILRRFLQHWEIADNKELKQLNKNALNHLVNQIHTLRAFGLVCAKKFLAHRQNSALQSSWEILPISERMMKMFKAYIPVATSNTIYYEPQTKEEFDGLMESVNVGDMVYNKWVFSGLWYTVGLNDENDPTSKCLFPNIIMDEHLPPLTRWGLARLNFLKSERKFMAAQFSTISLHKHCLEIEKQAEARKRNMMTAICKNPANRVTEHDKIENPIAWAQRMNQFQAQIHEVINADLIFS
jgi:hypothetical protein